MAYQVNPVVAPVAPPPIAEAEAWIAGRDFPADKPLMDVAQAVPGYPPADALSRHLAEAVLEPETARYTEIAGLPALRGALAAHMRESYGGEVAPDQVCITAGCNQAFCLAMTALAAPGDEVLLPVPYYFNHQMWLEMQGIRPVHLPFRRDRGGVPDPADAAERMTARSRAIVLVTPNNPTGAVYPPEVLAAFLELARDRGVALVTDETYKDFRASNDPPHGLFADPRWPDSLVQLYSFSKVYSLTGYRTGSIVCGPALMAEVTKIMDCVAICAPRIGQRAALFGLAELAGWREEKRLVMQERVEALRAAFTANDLAYELVSIGAYFAYLRHPFAGVPAHRVARRLAQAENLLCLPGGMFGPGQDEYLRFAFANLEAEAMPDLARRLRASQDWPDF